MVKIGLVVSESSFLQAIVKKERKKERRGKKVTEAKTSVNRGITYACQLQPGGLTIVAIH